MSDCYDIKLYWKKVLPPGAWISLICIRPQTSCRQVRMNGGTNVALAIQTASKHMQSSLAVGAPRTVILLTDGRIDHYQGKCKVCSNLLVQLNIWHMGPQWLAMETLPLLKGDSSHCMCSGVHFCHAMPSVTDLH